MGKNFNCCWIESNADENVETLNYCHSFSEFYKTNKIAFASSTTPQILIPHAVLLVSVFFSADEEKVAIIPIHYFD